MNKDQISQAINAATIPIDGTSDTRDLSPVRISQVGLVYRVARQKFGLLVPDSDPMEVTLDQTDKM